MTYQEFCAQFERIPKAANAFSRIDPNHSHPIGKEKVER